MRNKKARPGALGRALGNTGMKGPATLQSKRGKTAATALLDNAPSRRLAFPDKLIALGVNWLGICADWRTASSLRALLPGAVMTPLVRAVTLTGYREVARHLELDPYEMLRASRISPDALSDPENRLPASNVMDLLDRSAEQAGRSDFGLLMAQCRTYPSLGPVALLIEHLPTVRDIIAAASEYRRHLNDIMVFGTEETQGAGIFKVELSARFASLQASTLAIGVAFIVLRGASRRNWSPQSVHFKFAAPPELGAFKRFFPAPIEFGSSFNGFTSSDRSLAMRLPWADDTMASHARRLLELVPIHPEDCPNREAVRRSIMLLLPSGRATLTNVAANLAMSERTLQRELDKEGVGFAAILNEARRDLALRHLGHPAQSISAIGELLGYASLSSFTRWFNDEFGCSPRAWRDIESTSRKRFTRPAISIERWHRRDNARSKTLKLAHA